MSAVRALQVWKGKLKAFVLTAILGGAVLAWVGTSVVHVTPAHIRVLAVPTNDDCTTCYYYYYNRNHRRHSGAPNAGPGIGKNPSVPRSSYVMPEVPEICGIYGKSSLGMTCFPYPNTRRHRHAPPPPPPPPPPPQENGMALTLSTPHIGHHLAETREQAR